MGFLRFRGEFGFDLILMDVQMPVMDGIEATWHIRKLTGSDARPQIIALSAGALEEKQQAALDAAMNSFLAKPLQSADFTEALSRVAESLAAGD